MTASNTIYTIGHSNHEIVYFAEMLELFGINCVIDVRSVPASAYSPHFNREPLGAYLKLRNIAYLHFGSEFGARRAEPEVLDKSGKVDFDKVRKSSSFLSGVERLKAGLNRGYVGALMCSEAEPFDCHRFSLISYYLARNGFTVKHILKDKTAIDNSVLEKRLLRIYDNRIPKPDLFNPVELSPNEQLERAYQMRGRDVAYSST
jgi:uncharacterized protein (DUF488 family)